MKVIITGRKVTLRDSFKEMANKKLSKFDRIFGEDTIANVTVTLERKVQRVEITIRYNGKIYRAESDTSDMNESLDHAVDAIGGQIRKNKSRLEKQLRSGVIDEHLPGWSENEQEADYEIVRSKKFEVKPLTEEEAILQMNLVGHQFYLFINSETNEINVVYKRKNGQYGLLQPKIQ